MSVIFNQPTQLIAQEQFINFSHHEIFRSYVNFYLFIRSNVLISHLLHHKMKCYYCHHIHMGSLVPSYPLQLATYFAARHTAMNILKSTQHTRNLASSVQILSAYLTTCLVETEKEREVSCGAHSFV
jgi:hypothetical protein